MDLSLLLFKIILNILTHFRLHKDVKRTLNVEYLKIEINYLLILPLEHPITYFNHEELVHFRLKKIDDYPLNYSINSKFAK